MGSEDARASRPRAGRDGWKLLLLVLVGCGPVVGSLPAEGAGGTAVEADARIDELATLYDRRDFFALRDRLGRRPGSDSPVEDLLRAAVQAAFNEPARSNGTLAALEARGAALPDTLVPLFHRLRYRNHMRLHAYGDALAAAREILALSVADSSLRADVRNTVRILEALQGVPPQRVVRRGDSEIRRLPNTRLPVEIGDSMRAYALDTGANLSVMMRSEAEALGLRIRDADVEVGTVTDIRVTADVAVADRVRLGGIELSDVVFLVLPDEALTFQGGFTIPGLIGFPVIEALGEVRFRDAGVVSVPAEPSGDALRNIALDGLTPLIRVGVFGETVICRLDTGAGATSFYAHFYERHRDRVEALGRDTVLTTTGVGGAQRSDAYVLPALRLALGDSEVTLGDVEVLTEPAASDRDSLACNLGLDALRSGREYVINFRSMTFMLR